jgi:hypothetical protein
MPEGAVYEPKKPSINMKSSSAYGGSQSSLDPNREIKIFMKE